MKEIFRFKTPTVNNVRKRIDVSSGTYIELDSFDDKIKTSSIIIGNEHLKSKIPMMIIDFVKFQSKTMEVVRELDLLLKRNGSSWNEYVKGLERKKGSFELK